MSIEWADVECEAVRDVFRRASFGPQDVLDALAPHVAALVRGERAKALREAADRFPVANHMLIGGKDARNWLRARAERTEAEQ